MNRYAPLFELEVEHGNDSGGRCRDLAVALEPGSARRLAGHRGLAGVRPGGLIVRVEVEGEPPRALIEPGDELGLGFELRVLDPQVRLVTALTELDELDAPVFVADADADEDPSRLRAVAGGGALGPDVLARVELRELGPRWSAWLAEPPRLRIVLEPRSLRWIYYVVCGPTVAGGLTIVDEDPARAPKIVFAREPEASEADDRLAHELRAGLGAGLGAGPGERQLVRLISTAPLACREAPRRRLALRSDALVLVAELPNPAPAQVTRLTPSGADEAEDFLHCVLRI